MTLYNDCEIPVRSAVENNHQEALDSFSRPGTWWTGAQRAEDCCRNPARAALWYGRAADQGYALAQSSLGYMYLKGDGVPRDSVQAHKWFSLSASQNYATAADARNAIAEGMAPEEIESAQ